MVMSNPIGVWTRDLVLALPDDGSRYELVDGDLLVTPSPRPIHQLTVAALALRIGPYVNAHGLGALLIAPADLDFGAGQLLQPDLFVVRPLASPLRDWSQVGLPSLVIEVASPATARADRFTKRRHYQRFGVPAYWAVDPATRRVEVWTSDGDSPLVEDQSLVWRPAAAVPPLTLALPDLFRAVWGS